MSEAPNRRTITFVKKFMRLTATQAERRQRINRVLDYIFTHLDQELTTEVLGGIACYSPFHLQKTFKEVMGQSPKQYALALRLETAFHLLVIHPHKPIGDIALETGFSSPAIFSRAIRNSFGYSPGQLRLLSHQQKMRLLHTSAPSPLSQASSRSIGLPGFTAPLSVEVVRMAAVSGIYVLVSFHQTEAIQQAFRTLASFATANGYPVKDLRGIMAPHQRNTYRAFLPIDSGAAGTASFSTCTIPAGLYARFSVKGGLDQLNKAAHYFLDRWLPESGYKIAGITGFETFSGDPVNTPDDLLQREIHIPIEPVL